MRKSKSYIGSLYKIYKSTDINKNYKISSNNLLNFTNCYHFVNLPTSSKYYHQQLPKSIDVALRIVQKENKLNEKCFLLEHLAQLLNDNPKFLSYSTKQLISKQLAKWKDQQGRMQRVASIAWVIHKLKLKDQLTDLYEEIFERILNDQWYVDFYEAVKAIQAYSSYPDRQRRNLFLQKIQRNIIISISDFNMIYYQKICLSLIQAERYNSPLWEKLEQFVIRNLSMPYSARTFFDIFKSFAISQNGTQQFYQICQQVIRKGHLYSITHRIRSNLGDFDSSGDYFALMIDTYAVVQRNTPFRLSGDFMDYIYKSMLTSKLEYKEISSLTKIIKGMPILQFYSQQISKVVNDIIKNKEFSNYQNLHDIQQLYFVLEQYLGLIPQKIDLNIQKLIIKDLQRNILPLPTAIDLVGFVLMFRQRTNQPEGKQIDNSKLIEHLNKSIQKKYKYLEYQQAKVVRQMLSTTPSIQNHIDKKILLPKGTQTN